MSLCRRLALRSRLLWACFHLSHAVWGWMVANHTIGRDRRSPVLVRQQLEEELRRGATIVEALSIVGRSRSWYESQRRSDREWAGQVDRIRSMVQDPTARDLKVPDFVTFSERYLGRKLWPHQLNMVDVLEGREPSWLHDSMKWVPGAAGYRRLLINIPPNHAKSMTVTIERCVYEIVRDPNVNILLVSKTQDLAKKMLYAVKQRLTHPRYADLQLAFGPVDGWKSTADQWSSTKLYLGADVRDSASKDPTIEAIGAGGQIYGNRATKVILDDVVTLSNAGQWENQMDWIRQEVASRLGPEDQLIVVGTRVASVDLYRELMNPDHYNDGVVPWSYLSMPAVLEYGDSSEDTVTLWPVSDEPFHEADVPDGDGNYPRWTGERLARVRNEVGPRKWSLVYQQQDVSEDAVFDPVAVKACVNGFRKAGPLNPSLKGHPASTDGFYTICSMDPAVAGNTAAVAYSVNRQTGMRYVLDVQVLKGPTPKQIRDLIELMTVRYEPNEWVIESNAFQGFLSQDEEIRQFLASRGIVLKPHHTGSNKKDPVFGVASMSGLLGTVATVQGNLRRHQGDNLVEFPSQESVGVKMLVDELVAWNPEVKTKYLRQDTVMAWWFAELRARDVVLTAKRGSFWHARGSGFLSPRDRERQVIVNLDDYMQAQDNQAVWV